MKELPHSSEGYDVSLDYIDKHTKHESIYVDMSIIPFVQNYSVVDVPSSSKALRMQNSATNHNKVNPNVSMEVCWRLSGKPVEHTPAVVAREVDIELGYEWLAYKRPVRQ